MLEDLTQSIETLLARYEKVKSDNVVLQERLEACTAKLDANKSTIEILEKKISDLQLSHAFAVSSEKDGKDAKKRVGKLIREIDNCIELLGG